ncbi:MAG: 3-carboxy-cis,cis-muconate cycloisomerase [Alphaproteobacteria bacterium]|nr:3-carboxy-cis,cis-muconate cycloisomerase [Alphaproteobacteria bacterium]
MTDAFDSEIYGGLFAPSPLAALFSDANHVRTMLIVEAALARVQAKLGIIPSEAGAEISRAIESIEIDIAALRDGTTSAGLPIPALVAQIRAAVGGEAAEYVHWGATSQDIMDTALTLVLRVTSAEMIESLLKLSGQLATMAETHRGTIMLARTRSQQAAPTSFGLKAAGWRAPLVRHTRRMAEMRQRLCVIQFGGAAGTLAPLGDRGVEVMEGLLQELGLNVPPLPWHTQRDNLGEFAGWLATLTGALGKIGQDVALLAQTEVAEVRESADPTRGGSSTLPQKSNPILSEALITLARYTAGNVATFYQSGVQEHERGGPGWALEWLVLPKLVIAASTALTHAVTLIENLQIDQARMTANMAAANGLFLAEAASFALSEHLPRTEAQALVKTACQQTMADGGHLMDILAELTDAPVDWTALKDPARYIGVADTLIDRALAES